MERVNITIQVLLNLLNKKVTLNEQHFLLVLASSEQLFNSLSFNFSLHVLIHRFLAFLPRVRCNLWVSGCQFFPITILIAFSIVLSHFCGKKSGNPDLKHLD